ncbi:hypothetical protein BGZ94_002734 [Podila epigama]|nr:hypothetical protein BGZ94_002734 [Podila epigama]
MTPSAVRKGQPSGANPFSKVVVGFGTRSTTSLSAPATGLGTSSTNGIKHTLYTTMPKVSGHGPSGTLGSSGSSIFNFGKPPAAQPILKSTHQVDTNDIQKHTKVANLIKSPIRPTPSFSDSSFNADDFLDDDLGDLLEIIDSADPSPQSRIPYASSDKKTPAASAQCSQEAHSEAARILQFSSSKEKKGEQLVRTSIQMDSTKVSRRDLPSPTSSTTSASSTNICSIVKPEAQTPAVLLPRRSPSPIVTDYRAGRAVSLPAPATPDESSPWIISGGSSIVASTGSNRPSVADTVDSRTNPHLNPFSRNSEDRGHQEGGARRVNSSSSLLSNANRRDKRRIPGPAGNLPKLTDEEKEALFRSRSLSSKRGNGVSSSGTRTVSGPASPESMIKLKMLTMPQGPQDAMFANWAWDELLTTYRLPNYRPSTLNIFKGTDPWITTTISDITNQKGHHRGKIEKLVVMIKTFTLSEMDAAVTLLDPSGEMRGTMHRQVLEEYKNEIKVGTVLALKDVAIFSFTSVSHYLNITPRNIEHLFQVKPGAYPTSQDSSQRSADSQYSPLHNHNLRKRKFPGDESSSQERLDPNGAIQLSSSSEKGSSQKSQDSIISIASSPLKHRARSPTPDWNVIQSPRILDAKGQGSVGPESPGQGIESASSLTLSQHSSSPTLSNQGSQQGIQFQSLMPPFSHDASNTFGNRSTLGEKRPELAQTPSLTVGVFTPRESFRPLSSVTPRASLLSFAASGNLRSRVSPETQRTLPQPLTLPRRHPSITKRSDPTGVRPSSPDWPDDLGDLDFEDESLVIPDSSPSKAATATPAPTSLSSSKSTPPKLQQNAGGAAGTGDDELDFLFEGLDESQLLEEDF